MSAAPLDPRRDPERSTDVNVNATKSLLSDARATGVGKLVFAAPHGQEGNDAVILSDDGAHRERHHESAQRQDKCRGDAWIVFHD